MLGGETGGSMQFSGTFACSLKHRPLHCQNNSACVIMEVVKLDYNTETVRSKLMNKMCLRGAVSHMGRCSFYCVIRQTFSPILFASKNDTRKMFY